MITLFEEYKYIKFKRKGKKDPNEPFWNAPKKEYLKKKKEEEDIIRREKQRIAKEKFEEAEKKRIEREKREKAIKAGIEKEKRERRERERRERLEEEARQREIKRREELAKVEAQKPLIEKYIDIINKGDLIRKTKREIRDAIYEGKKIKLTLYGILFRDKSLITVSFYTLHGVQIIHELKINKELMSPAKEKMERDPYNEEV